MQRSQLLLPGQGPRGLLFQGFRRRHLQLLSAQHALADLAVAFAKDWPGLLLRVVGQEEPVAVAPGDVDRGVAPGLGGFGAAGAAGLEEGVPGAGQPEGGQAEFAALAHAVQRGQVFAVLDGVAGPAQNLFHRVLTEGVEPELLDLTQLLGIRVGGIILVVVVQSEQGEDLVDRLDMRGVRAGAFRRAFTLPRMCR